MASSAYLPPIRGVFKWFRFSSDGFGSISASMGVRKYLILAKNNKNNIKIRSKLKKKHVLAIVVIVDSEDISFGRARRVRIIGGSQTITGKSVLFYLIHADKH